MGAQEDNAVSVVRKKCLQHTCTKKTPCTHRNHRRDADFLQYSLEMLGLSEEKKEAS